MMAHDEDDKKMKLACIANLMKKAASEDFDHKFGAKKPVMIEKEHVEVHPLRKLNDMSASGEEHEMEHVDVGSDEDENDMHDMSHDEDEDASSDMR